MDARISPPHVRQWAGSSRGHWEGDTLVVETTNLEDSVHQAGGFAQSTRFRCGDLSDAVTVVERFTRVDAETLAYEFTVTDLKTWTQPLEWVAPHGAYGRPDIRVPRVTKATTAWRTCWPGLALKIWEHGRGISCRREPGVRRVPGSRRGMC